MIDWLRGLHTPAWVVGTVRGAVEAGVMAFIAAVALYFIEDPRFVALGPLIVLIERTVEGWADHIDPAKRRAP